MKEGLDGKGGAEVLVRRTLGADVKATTDAVAARNKADPRDQAKLNATTRS